MIPHSFAKSELVVVHVIDDPDDMDDDDIQIPAYDIRANKPLGVHSLEDRQIAFFQRLMKAKVHDRTLQVAAPSEISLSLSVAKKSQVITKHLREKIAKQVHESTDNVFNQEVSIAYDYLEQVQIAIVFSYKAIESFCNETIPDDHVYAKISSKGIEERYGKEQIERWISTTEKVADILPGILGSLSPKNEAFWSNFKNLERLRHEIVHSKTNVKSAVLEELFTDAIDSYVESGFDLLNYFISQDPTNQLFPLGFGTSKMRVIEVKNSDEIIEKIE